MGDRVAVMDNGRFEQIDNPVGVYRRPATIFVAGFLGSPRMNLIQGVLEPAGAETTLVSAGPATWRIPATDLTAEDRRPVGVGFRPEAVHLFDPDGPALGHGDAVRQSYVQGA